MTRKLVTLRTIISVTSIEGADRIEAVGIDGWISVCPKGIFKVGDIGIYHEIDSFIPLDHPRYQFLTNLEHPREFDGKEGIKLKTKRLKKVWSQGLLMPLSDFPELKGKSVGDDVTELVGVVLWEPPIQISTKAGKGTRIHPFPSFIPKTDEERVQNIPWVLNDKEQLYEVTEKLDGTSFTAFYGGPTKEFGVCSRNIWLKPYTPNLKQKIQTFWWNYKKAIQRRWDFRFWKFWHTHDDTGTDNIYWTMAKRYELDKNLPLLEQQYAIQGEIIGEGIQKNPYKLHGQELYIFNIYNITQNRYLRPDERRLLLLHLNIEFNMDLQHVPIMHPMVGLELHSMENLLGSADGPSFINSKVNREGLVFKSLTDPQHSFKVISNKYLLKSED